MASVSTVRVYVPGRRWRYGYLRSLVAAPLAGQRSDNLVQRSSRNDNAPAKSDARDLAPSDERVVAPEGRRSQSAVDALNHKARVGERLGELLFGAELVRPIAPRSSRTSASSVRGR